MTATPPGGTERNYTVVFYCGKYSWQSYSSGLGSCIYARLYYVHGFITV